MSAAVAVTANSDVAANEIETVALLSAANDNLKNLVERKTNKKNTNDDTSFSNIKIDIATTTPIYNTPLLTTTVTTTTTTTINASQNQNETSSVFGKTLNKAATNVRLFNENSIAKQRAADKNNSMISIGKLKNDASMAGGYLQSENVFSSATSTSSAESESEGAALNSENETVASSVSGNKVRVKRKTGKMKSIGQRKSVQRSYDIASVAGSDDLIVNQLSADKMREATEHDSSAVTTDTDTSSSSSESVDTDDTGTIADRRPKKRHFSKVFVVNRHAGPRLQRAGNSSTENDSQSSDANLEDSSDNDTDVERPDCGIVLNYMKPIDVEGDNKSAGNRRTAGMTEGDSSSQTNVSHSSPTSSDTDDDDDDVGSSGQHYENIIDKYVATSETEIANCIIVVGGMTDNDNGGVVLNAMRALSSDDDVAVTAAITLSTDTLPREKKYSLGKKAEVDLPNPPSNAGAPQNAFTVEKAISNAVAHRQTERLNEFSKNASVISETNERRNESSLALPMQIDAQEACKELNSIANDVNRLLSLTKQNSELEIKLQKLRKDVAEINQDHISRGNTPEMSTPTSSSSSSSPSSQSSAAGTPELKRCTSKTSFNANNNALTTSAPITKTTTNKEHTVQYSTYENKQKQQYECDMAKNSTQSGMQKTENDNNTQKQHTAAHNQIEKTTTTSVAALKSNEKVHIVCENTQIQTNAREEMAKVELPANAWSAEQFTEPTAATTTTEITILPPPETTALMYEAQNMFGSKNLNVEGSEKNKLTNVHIQNKNEQQKQKQQQQQLNYKCNYFESNHDVSHNINVNNDENKIENINEIDNNCLATAMSSGAAVVVGNKNKVMNACKDTQLETIQSSQLTTTADQNIQQQQDEEEEEKVETKTTNPTTINTQHSDYSYNKNSVEQTVNDLPTTITKSTKALTQNEQKHKTPEQTPFVVVAATGAVTTDTADINNKKRVKNEYQQTQVKQNEIPTITDDNTTIVSSAELKENNKQRNASKFVCAAAPNNELNELAKKARVVVENDLLNEKDGSGGVSADISTNSNSVEIEQKRKNIDGTVQNVNYEIAQVSSLKEMQSNLHEITSEYKANNEIKEFHTNNVKLKKNKISEDIVNTCIDQNNLKQIEIIENLKHDLTNEKVNALYAPIPSCYDIGGTSPTNTAFVDSSSLLSSGTKQIKNIGSPKSLSAKYRSLVMITKDNNNIESAITSDTNTNVNTDLNPTVTSVKQQSHDMNSVALIDACGVTSVKPSVSGVQVKHDHNDMLNERQNDHEVQHNKNKDTKTSNLYACDALTAANNNNDRNNERNESYLSANHFNTVNDVNAAVTSANSIFTSLELLSDNDDSKYSPTTSAKNTTGTVCLEDGLADDDSWVEEISQNGDEFIDEDSTTPTASDSEDLSVDGEDSVAAGGMYIDREEELRGYHRSAIDFTLHTIVEESCEESEVASLRDNEHDIDEEMDEAERRRQRTINHHNRLSASDLEKYFFFGLADGKVMSSIDTRGDDTASEVSSECSESLDSLGIPEEPDLTNAADLASSRLEKYFLSGFMGFNTSAEKNESDESGSVGSDSEGHPSPSQRRKRLVRARGTPRSHNSSLDNLLADTQYAGNESLETNNADALDSSESEGCDETIIHAGSASEKDGTSSDTMKRKKQLRKRHDSLDEKKLLDSTDDINKLPPASECRTPTPGSISSAQAKKQQHHSRDSGFVGSNDDLLKAPECETISVQIRAKSPTALAQIHEDKEITTPTESTGSSSSVSPPLIPEIVLSAPTNPSPSSHSELRLTKKPPLPPATNSTLVRKDSFNNWSSDEETNLMMSKMRQFFKTLVVATANAQQNLGSANSSKTATPNQTTPISVRRMRNRPAQLAYFENELTRLMKTVPGINDEQVREIVEYLSSEDAWSDSCDSSDYTSSDLEGSQRRKSELKEQISASCQQIITKFEVDEEGDRGDGGLLDEAHALNADTAFVYQKLMESFSKIAVGNVNTLSPTIATANGVPNFDAPSGSNKNVEEDQISTSSTRSAERSPQLFTKVMQHIGTRLVALMHEVSSGNDTHGTNSPMPPQRNHHKRLQAKISATTTEDEEDNQNDKNQAKGARGNTHMHQHNLYQPSGSNKSDDPNNLARSKSHDLLLDSAASISTACSSGSGSNAINTRPHHHQSSSGVSDTAGEECGVASDYERFSWRGSFESALLANGDSRTKLSQLDRDNLSSASALAIAKRRSAGDLLFNHHKSLSREQLDRVRSCGSIGGGDEHHNELEASPAKPWVSSNDTKDVRRSSVPDAIYELDSSDDEAFGTRSTLPRSLTSATQVASTNSLPRLPTSSLGAAAVSATSTPATKSQNALNFTSTSSAKSARYRSPGLANRSSSSIGSKKSSSSLSLQHFLYSKRDTRKRLNMSAEEAKAAAEELSRSPVLGQRNDPASSPIQSRGSAGSDNWPTQSDEDIDRLVAMHQNRSSLSSLGLRSDSMASVYSGAGEGRYGTVAVKGQVEFGMQYNYKLSALEIHVVRCKDLAAVDVKRNRSDPYVKVYLLPDKSKAGKRKTKVKKHTLNPIFDEVLRFHMPIASLESRTLWLTVWHSDMFGRNDFLGEVSVSLQGKVFDNPQSQLYTLQERSEPFDEVATNRGDIVVGLKFIPPENIKPGFMRGSSITGSSSNLRKFGSIKSVASKSDRLTKGGQLHVLVKEAKNLSPIKANGTCDAFCKSYLLPDRTRSSKQKTPVVKRSLHPTWNYTFVYEDVSLDDLSERALELTVWDHDRLASNEFLGGVRFSLGTGKSYGRQCEWMDASGKELSLWQNMIDRPNFWVEGSLILRSTLDGIRSIP
ncbi:uncharacterized protein LOC119678642 [Teleopsis dalmanni]|uniref:uncharacterized protein LOC119678642 n=1 Tax=Teleopsis dalmanni TaxID=139649 RepID=UPI0018CC8E7E|nr:uncharacterized protein LOC119678642 [Teleopsis dalmanni]